MKIVRYAWSGYVPNEMLEREQNRIQSISGVTEYFRPKKPAVVDNVETADILITNSQHEINSRVLDQFPGLRLVVTTTSGYDHVNLSECGQRGIQVARTPEARGDYVTNHTLAMANSLIRNLPSGNHLLRHQTWGRDNLLSQMNQWEDLTAGILGWGVIGKKVASVMSQQARKTLVHDPNHGEELSDHPELTGVEQEPLFEQADLISLHAPLTEKTQNLVDEEVLAKINGYLINTARGKMIRWDDLLTSLHTGALKGAGLDVFPTEPLPPETQLPPNLLITPHVAGFGPDMLDKLATEIIATIQAFTEDKPLPHAVNPDPSS